MNYIYEILAVELIVAANVFCVSYCYIAVMLVYVSEKFFMAHFFLTDNFVISNKSYKLVLLFFHVSVYIHLTASLASAK